MLSFADMQHFATTLTVGVRIAHALPGTANMQKQRLPLAGMLDFLPLALQQLCVTEFEG